MKPIILTLVLLTNVLNVELAATRAEKEKGMMYRRSWAAIDGMLFINKEPGRVYYWMKNTYLPMTMFFLDPDMAILESYNPRPLSTDIVSSEATNVQFVLELNPDMTNLVLTHYEAFQAKLGQKLISVTNKMKSE